MWTPHSILLGPGGIKGFMELGFLLYMEKMSLLKDIKAYAGVSIGSIISLLLVVGYSVYEIIDIASKTDIFMNMDSVRLGDILKGQGIIPHDTIKSMLEDLVKSKFGKVLSLLELYQATGIDLYITSLSLHHKDPIPVYFSHKTEPNISCVDAVLLSMNIPIIFQRLYYKGKKYVDGAIGDPYPIHLLDNGTDNVLGVYLSSEFDESDDVITYIRQVMYASMVQLRRLMIERASEKCKHVGLYSKNYDSVGIITSSEDKITMITEGYDVATKFFKEFSTSSQLIVSPKNIESIEDA